MAVAYGFSVLYVYTIGRYMHGIWIFFAFRVKKLRLSKLIHISVSAQPIICCDVSKTF